MSEPFEGASIHEKALEVSGVTREDLAEYDDMKSVGDRLKGVLDSHVDRYDPTDKMFFLAYNAPFDEAFFRAFMKRTGINHWGNYFWNPSVCVMQLAGVFLMNKRQEVGELPNFKLTTVYKYITGDDLQGAHDAMADIRATKDDFLPTSRRTRGLGLTTQATGSFLRFLSLSPNFLWWATHLVSVAKINKHQTKKDKMLNNIDLSNVDTEMPVLCDGTYNFEIKEFEVAENKKKTGHNLCVKFALTTPGDSVKARERGESNDISPGFQVRKYYPLQQSDNENAPDFRRDLAVLQEAALGAKGELNNETLEQLRGKQVAIKVKVTDSDVYGLGNDVVRVMPPIQ